MIAQNNIGGSALASGGFGCVFSPSLKCEDKKKQNPQRKKRVSFLSFSLLLESN
jgi:hypothetical protein